MWWHINGSMVAASVRAHRSCCTSACHWLRQTTALLAGPQAKLGKDSFAPDLTRGRGGATAATATAAGPLNAYDSRGCPIQVGLVSWGHEDCGSLKNYGVYTRISYHAAWLRRHVPGLEGATAAHTAMGNDLSAGEFVAQVQALTAGARDITIAIKPAGTIKLGGTFNFEVRSKMAGRLLIIDVNAEGIATQIFPNEFVAREDLSLVQAGGAVTVPGPGYGFDYFRAAPPLGKGRLITVVLPPDFPVQTFITAPVRSKGFIAERSATGYFMNLLQQIRTLIVTQRSNADTRGLGLAVADQDYEIVQ